MRKTVLALLLVAACGRAPAPPTPPAGDAAKPKPRLVNLLDLSRGGSVVSRTGEGLLTSTPARMIDGDRMTSWLSPPYDPRQSIVFSLPSRSRIERVGFVAGPSPAPFARRLSVELSDDGVSFRPAGTFTLAGSHAVEPFDITPAEASFVRVSVLEGAEPRFSAVSELIVDGKQLAPHELPAITGCWSVNGARAGFRQTAGAVAGFVEGKVQTEVEGGSNGDIFRFAWVRGPQYGLAAVTLTPDGGHMAGLVWHEAAAEGEKFLASDWIGERNSPSFCAPSHAPSVFRTFMDRLGYFPLYGLRFAADGRMDEEASAPTLLVVTQLLAANPRLNLRFVAHELRLDGREQNLRVAETEVTTLRAALERRGVALAHVTFVAAGEQNPRRKPTNDLTRAMYSAVEIQVAR